MCNVLYFLTAILVVELSGVYAQMKMGPYEYVEITNFEQCPDKESLECKYDLKIGNTDGKNVLVGNINCPFPVDEKITLDFLALRQNNNGEYQFFYPYKGENACAKAMGGFPEYMNELFKAIDKPAECPLPAGKFEVKNMPTKYQFTKYPSLFYGNFRIDVSYLKNDTQVACYRLYATVQPNTFFG